MCRPESQLLGTLWGLYKWRTAQRQRQRASETDVRLSMHPTTAMVSGTRAQRATAVHLEMPARLGGDMSAEHVRRAVGLVERAKSIASCDARGHRSCVDQWTDYRSFYARIVAQC